MKWSKSPQQLVDTFETVAPSPPARLRKMFGYPAAFVNGNMFMGLFQEDMILRLPEPDRTELLKVEGASIFEPMPGRRMHEYVVVPGALVGNLEQLRLWVARALRYAEKLKPKAAKPKSGSATKSVGKAKKR